MGQEPRGQASWISDLKLGDKVVEDMHRLCSCVDQAHGSLAEVDTQWVIARIRLFNFRSAGFARRFSRIAGDFGWRFELDKTGPRA